MQYATVHSQEPPPADARRGNTKEPPQKKLGLIGFILVMLMHPTPGNRTRPGSLCTPDMDLLWGMPCESWTMVRTNQLDFMSQA